LELHSSGFFGLRLCQLISIIMRLLVGELEIAKQSWLIGWNVNLGVVW